MYQGLTAFKQYQAGQGTFDNGDPASTSFDTAISEINAGAKTVLVIGLGTYFPTDKPSRVFDNLFTLTHHKTLMYLADDTLRTNYVRFMHAVSDQLDRGAYPLILLMSDTDVYKEL